jgi:hypothetical protein
MTFGPSGGSPEESDELGASPGVEGFETLTIAEDELWVAGAADFSGVGACLFGECGVDGAGLLGEACEGLDGAWV